MQPFPEDTPAARILAAVDAIGAPELGPGEARTGPWLEQLRSLDTSRLLGIDAPRDPEAGEAVRAGLLLFAGHLDSSHRISQGISGADGSYWHGIMHRREPDYGNAKYWFRRVGDHPVYLELPERLPEPGPAAGEILANGSWDPFRMVDLVEACERRRRPELREELLELQRLEMLLLLARGYRQVTGRG